MTATKVRIDLMLYIDLQPEEVVLHNAVVIIRSHFNKVFTVPRLILLEHMVARSILLRTICNSYVISEAVHE